MTNVHVQDAERLLHDRAVRRDIFGVVADGFGEPAWEILLRLYVEEARGHELRARDLTDVADDPINVVEIYLNFLASHRTVRLEGTGSEQRVTFTDRGRELMERYLQKEAIDG